MEKLEWNLKELFVNNKAFYKEIEKIKLLLDSITIFNNIKIDTSDILLEILNKKWYIKELTNKVLVYGSLMYYKNINDSNCINMKKDAETLDNEVNNKLLFIDLLIIETGKDAIDKLIASDSRLKIYKLALDDLFRKQKYLPSKINSVKIQDNSNEINSQLSKYNNLLRDIDYGKINIDGNIIQIDASNFNKYISNYNRDIRKDTYITVNNSFKNEENTFADILNNIYSYRKENCLLEGYNTVLDKVLFEENINSKIIKNLINSVNNNLILIQKYLRLKAKYHNINDPHLYDLTIPLNKVDINFTIEEALDIIKDTLKPLGKEYLNTVDKLLNGHFDAIPDENKHQSITFSWNTYSFINFRGTYNDLKNMIHELGHIVNYYFSKDEQPFIYADSTIFVGETASLVNEILLNRYLYENAKTKEEKIYYLSKEIENFFTSVFKQTMYTELEIMLYNENELTPDILTEKYSNLIHKYYGEDIIYDDISSIEWTRLGHLFRWSFYPYKYATGLLIASLVVNSLFESQTLSVSKYIDFLKAGSSKYSLDLLKDLNIDVINENLLNDGFKVLEKDIENLEILIKERRK